MTSKTAFNSVKLSKPCDLCKKNIYLGDDVVITKKFIVHLKCYDKSKRKGNLK